MLDFPDNVIIVFPAYAGMIPPPPLKPSGTRRVPRIRGDDP